ncbi:MAG: amino acid ABC transporter ATP-binding protein [Bacteroidaceae bacterium]|nr:amino acid ABC transporter ATP-binding protein [Bacteroidaceae bacterium]
MFMVEVSELKKTFGGRTVLNGISFTLGEHDTLCVVGPTGCGKSTLLRCVAGLEEPDSGSVVINGEPRRLLSKGGVHSIGMVFQSYNLFPHLDVLNNVMLAPVRVLGMSKKSAEELAMKKLELVGLAEKASANVESLSAGQRQRVAIARCLAMEPSLLLLDEPTSALDQVMVSEMQCLVRDLSKRGMAMIIVTHDLQFAREVGNHVIFMNEGVVYEQGTPEEVFDSPKKEQTNVFVNTILDYSYQIHSHKYDLYELQAGMIQFCKRHSLGKAVQFRVQLLAEEVLNVIPLNLGTVELALRYSKKNGAISLELLMPQGVRAIFGTSELEYDEISMSIVRGLCDGIDELLEGDAASPRLRVRFQLKEMN